MFTDTCLITSAKDCVIHHIATRGVITCYKSVTHPGRRRFSKDDSWLGLDSRFLPRYHTVVHPQFVQKPVDVGRHDKVFVNLSEDRGVSSMVVHVHKLLDERGGDTRRDLCICRRESD